MSALRRISRPVWSIVSASNAHTLSSVTGGPSTLLNLNRPIPTSLRPSSNRGQMLRHAAFATTGAWTKSGGFLTATTTLRHTTCLTDQGMPIEIRPVPRSRYRHNMAAREHRDHVDSPSVRGTSVKLHEDTFEAVRREAARLNMNHSEFIRQCVEVRLAMLDTARAIEQGTSPGTIIDAEAFVVALAEAEKLTRRRRRRSTQ